jgi:hypothetical protein
MVEEHTFASFRFVIFENLLFSTTTPDDDGESASRVRERKEGKVLTKISELTIQFGNFNGV